MTKVRVVRHLQGAKGSSYRPTCVVSSCYEGGSSHAKKLAVHHLSAALELHYPSPVASGTVSEQRYNCQWSLESVV